MKEELTVDQWLQVLPDKTYNCEPYGLRMMPCNSDEWSVCYYNGFSGKYDDRFGVIVKKTLPECLSALYDIIHAQYPSMVTALTSIAGGETKWEQLNKRFDNALESMTDEDWERILKPVPDMNVGNIQGGEKWEDIVNAAKDYAQDRILQRYKDTEDVPPSSYLDSIREELILEYIRNKVTISISSLPAPVGDNWVNKHGLDEKQRSLFWSKVSINRVCWEWTGKLNKSGYGVFKINGGTQSAHRLAFSIISNIPVKELNIIAHKCDNPKCINPDHLFHTDIQGNMSDMQMKGRGRKANKISRYKGVSKRDENGRWRCNIRYKGQTIALGHYETEEEAARAYDDKLIQIYGYENVKDILNIPRQSPPTKK